MRLARIASRTGTASTAEVYEQAFELWHALGQRGITNDEGAKCPRSSTAQWQDRRSWYGREEEPDESFRRRQFGNEIDGKCKEWLGVQPPWLKQEQNKVLLEAG